MKKIFLPAILLVLLPNRLPAQSLPTSPTEVNSMLYGKIKVQRYYRVNLYTIDSANTKVYCAGSRTVRPELFYNLKEVNAKADIGKCTPCFLEAYDTDGKTIQKSASYNDCPVGKEITYFSNGKIKTIVYWRDNPNATWKDFKCGPTGDWLYYNEAGKVIKVECHDGDKPY